MSEAHGSPSRTLSGVGAPSRLSGTCCGLVVGSAPCNCLGSDGLTLKRFGVFGDPVKIGPLKMVLHRVAVNAIRRLSFERRP